MQLIVEYNATCGTGLRKFRDAFVDLRSVKILDRYRDRNICNTKGINIDDREIFQ